MLVAPVNLWSLGPLTLIVPHSLHFLVNPHEGNVRLKMLILRMFA